MTDPPTNETSANETPEDSVDECLKEMADALVDGMPYEATDRAKMLCVMIEKLCTDEDYAVATLALTVALRETLQEWAAPEDDDPDPDDKPVPVEDGGLKLVG
jgi:hypothetical protein